MALAPRDGGGLDRHRHTTPLHIVGPDSAWLAGDNHDTGKLRVTADQVGRLLTDDQGDPLTGHKRALVHHRVQIWTWSWSPSGYWYDDNEAHGGGRNGRVDLLPADPPPSIPLAGHFRWNDLPAHCAGDFLRLTRTLVLR